MTDHFHKVSVSGSVISIFGELSLRSFPPVSASLHRVARQLGYRDVTFDFRNTTSVYPNVAAPLVSIVRYLRQEYAVEFAIKEPADRTVLARLRNYGILNYLGVDKEQRFRSNSADPRVLVFQNSDRQFAVVDSILNAVLRKMSVDRSHIKALEWAVNEITDNVLNHSESKVGGCVIVNRVPSTEIIEFTVADSGIGIAQSLGVRDDEKAIEAAIQEGVTRNKQTNQGNGLYGTFRLSQISKAAFSLKSGSATLFVDRDGNVKIKRDKIPYRGTIVVCQIDCSRPDLIQRALVFDGRAHDPQFDYLEKMHEQDESDAIVVDAKDICKTFGSRESGKEARNYLKNVLRSYPARQICVNLQGINIISSSFADEVFGKLFVELGPMKYMRLVRLNNTCAEVEIVVDRAITLRAQTGLGEA